MSRIGRLPVVLPQGVTVNVDENNVVTVKGPKGTLVKKMSNLININIEGSIIHVARTGEDKEIRALHGLTRALIFNMVHGVSAGYEKKLELVGVGYRAAKQGKKLVLTVGFSHPVEFVEENGITFDVPAANTIIVKGIDKDEVGQIAAVIRETRKPEPYGGKGIKYSNEVVRRKEGKTGKKK